jgi:hypothetical protein
MLIKPDDKFVLYEYRYQDVESIFLDPSDSFLTINLMRQQPDNTHRCFVFETEQKSEIGSLIVSYCPSLAAWITENEAPIRKVSVEQLNFIVEHFTKPSVKKYCMYKFHIEISCCFPNLCELSTKRMKMKFLLL